MEAKLSVDLPCPICRSQVSAEYDFEDQAEGIIGRFLESVLRIQCPECEEVYCVSLKMIAEDDLGELPYDPDDVDAK